MFTKVTDREWKSKLHLSRVWVTRYKFLGITVFKIVTPAD